MGGCFLIYLSLFCFFAVDYLILFYSLLCWRVLMMWCVQVIECFPIFGYVYYIRFRFTFWCRYLTPGFVFSAWFGDSGVVPVCYEWFCGMLRNFVVGWSWWRTVQIKKIDLKVRKNVSLVIWSSRILLQNKSWGSFTCFPMYFQVLNLNSRLF